MHLVECSSYYLLCITESWQNHHLWPLLPITYICHVCTRNIWLWLIKRVSSFSINRTKREKIKTLVLGNVTLSFILISLDKESLDYILENVILLSKQFNTMCIHWCVNVYVSLPRVNNLFPMLKYLESIVITSNLQKYM